MAKSQEYRDAQDEVLQGVRRIEARLMKLAEAIGIDPTGRRDRMIQVTLDPRTFQITGLGLSVSDLVDFFQSVGVIDTVLLQYGKPAPTAFVA